MAKSSTSSKAKTVTPKAKVKSADKAVTPPKELSLRERVGGTVADLWLPVSYLLTYVLWLVDWYYAGEFKTVGDFIGGLILAVLVSAMSFWIVALGLLLLCIPVLLVAAVIKRLRYRG